MCKIVILIVNPINGVKRAYNLVLPSRPYISPDELEIFSRKENKLGYVGVTSSKYLSRVYNAFFAVGALGIIISEFSENPDLEFIQGSGRLMVGSLLEKELFTRAVSNNFIKKGLERIR